MLRRPYVLLLVTLLSWKTLLVAGSPGETADQHDARMSWWREARFGLFIHWGLYAVPAGEWGGRTDHGEWIRTTAQIPLAVYDRFVQQFNPSGFDPEGWVRTAREAGMKYVVITSKHHDGFCLFDAKESGFTMMSTPFKRDIMKALADACRKQGMKICWYYSIMDWHHPDYLPRRDWEKDRSAEGADFQRYVTYMKSELKDLLTQYGDIGVLWFDGEWESTWNTAEGRDLYDYVRSLEPGIIINNRVGAGRSGMEGFTKEGEFSGDFGTPEQEIPATGLPGVDWETCMTMNDHWGYNSHDTNWKSTKTLVRNLADIASKGGNFLLNVGPTSEGRFPEASLDRLREIGAWMKANGESIYGTTASPFRSLTWGRCTQKKTSGGTRLYLHVFDWPSDGKLVVPGLLNSPRTTCLLSDSTKTPLEVHRREDALVIDVPPASPDSRDAVVVLDIAGEPDVVDPPEIGSEFNLFVDTLTVFVTSHQRNSVLRYTIDGTLPGTDSPEAIGPILLARTATVRAQAFRNGERVSPSSASTFLKITPRTAERLSQPAPGLSFRYFEGDWDTIPDFAVLTPLKTGTMRNFGTAPGHPEHYGFEFSGYIAAPHGGMYAFYTDSDDGSRLYIGDSLIVDNNGLHGMTERRGVVALAGGLHLFRLTYFNKTGSDGLAVSWRGPGFARERVPDTVLFHRQ